MLSQLATVEGRTQCLGSFPEKNTLAIAAKYNREIYISFLFFSSNFAGIL